MSGPWDRPSEDREPLASDRDAAAEHPEAGEAPGDAWPSSDPWSDQRPAAGSGWDDWSTLRPPDDFVLEEPVSTLGDPWAESWVADEEAERQAADAPSPETQRWAEPQPERWAEPEPERWTEPEPERWTEPEQEAWPQPHPELEPSVASESEPGIAAGADAEAPLAGEGEVETEPAATGESAWTSMPVLEPEPASASWQPPEPDEREPSPDESARSAADDPTRQMEPPVDPWGAAATIEPAPAEPVAEVPHVAPWQASDDPWAAVVEPVEALPVASTVTDETSDMPSATLAEPASAAPETELPEPEPEAKPESGAPPLAEQAEPAPATGGWRRELLPAWLTGRTASAAAQEVPEAAEPAEAVAELADAEQEPALVDETPVSAAEVLDDATGPTGDSPEAAPLTDASEAPVEPIGAVAWEDDRAMASDEPVAMGGEGDTSSAGPEAEAEADAEAAAELETAASVQAWPEADVVAVTTGASIGEADATPDAAVDETGDRRFDAWLGAPVIGAAAAVGAAEPDLVDAEPDLMGAAPESESEPDVAEGVSAEAEATVTGAAAGEAVGLPDELVRSDAAARAAPPPDEESQIAEIGVEEASIDGQPWPSPSVASEDAVDDEAWVAEPEAWEPAPSALEPTSPETAPAEDVEQPGRSPWAAAAVAGAAGAAAGAAGAAGAAQGGAESTVAPAPGDTQPTWRPDWLPDLEELEPEEGTRVLPTDWTPPPVAAQPSDRGQLEPHATAARTRPASEVERELDEEAEAGASTAEQAVPWLIGFILLLAGMVIVLLALIFAGDGSLGGGSGQPTPEPSLLAGAVGTPSPSPMPDGSNMPSASPAGAGASATPAPSDGAVAGPQFGPIELVFQGRAAALAPIYLLHREFTTQEEASVLAQDPNLDVRRFAWAMDGTLGAGLYADLMVSVEPGVEKRQLADGISALTFGQTTATVYAVRVTQEGANDVAVVMAIDYASGDTAELARLTYQRPPAESRAALKEAQYQDEGGTVRLFWMEDNRLRLWVLNGGMWEIDPGDGAVTEVIRRPPILWSPDGRQTIVLTEDAGTTTLTRIDVDGTEHATTSVEGLVSHVRWSPESNRIVFTLGRSTASGGVLQDLFLWDLGEEAPTQITATGAGFGAEWMGSRVRWREDPGET